MATVEQAPAAAQNGTGIPVENPATGETIATVPTLGPKEVEELVARARAAQPAWEALGFEERGRYLLRMQKWITDNAERIIATIVSETGKTYEDAQLAEIMYGAAAFGFWAKEAEGFLADEHVKSANPFVKGKKLIVRYRPVGVVGVIGPWNFPLTNSFGDCIPAMAAGNAVVLKPSEVTPLTSLLMAEGLAACGLPDGVFQVATGDGATGTALVDEVDFVMFTGSTKTGKKVMERAAKTLTPVSLELGGKDPMIVLADADLERAANAASFYSMNNGGQVCISVERVYVEEPAYDEFVAKVTDKVRALRQGRPGDPGSVDIGAITFPPQLEIIDKHVQDAVKKGARVLVGGKEGSGPGRYYEPTVLVDVDHSMSCMTEETFGPTLPIMKVADAEEALRLANDSPYGLAASVWTKDVRRGEQIARRVEAGAVCVNDAQVNYTALELPMGGWKSSGLGTRHGAGGIRKYTQQQTLLVTRLAPKKDPHMFPYSARKTRWLGKLVRFLYGRGRRA
jgi:acyl-CoA reductase-like NAD-dependent aldehyde dehydrogenase